MNHNRHSQHASFILLAAITLYFPICAAENGGSCVQYVKAQKPGGFDWQTLKYTTTDAKTKKPKTVSESWVNARDLYTKYNVTKGSDARVDSVLVLSDSSPVGHVAIVTGMQDVIEGFAMDKKTNKKIPVKVAVNANPDKKKVVGKKINVKHSNWCSPQCYQVFNGYYYMDNNSPNKVSYNNMEDGTKKYTLLGFVYQPY